MAQKICPFLFSRPPRIWNIIRNRIYSVTSAASLHGPHEVDQCASESAEILSLQSSLKNKLQPDRLVLAIDSASDLNIALNLFNWASRQKNFYHTTDTYAHMIFKLGLSGDLQEMEVLLKEMGKSDLPYVEQAFGFLVCSFCKNNMLVEALLVFENSTHAKCRLPLSTCNTLLNSLAMNSGNLHSVLFVYKEMVKAGMCPNVETLNYLIRVLCEAGLLDIALKQFSRMEKKQCAPNSQTFEILICSLCSSGKVDEAVKMLNQMLELCCSTDLELYGRIIPVLCRVNRFEESMKLFKLMKGAGFQLSSLCEIMIQCLCRNQQMVTAMELYDEMVKIGFVPTNAIYVDIVGGYCKLERLNEAANFLGPGRISDIEPYNTLLKGYIDFGMLGKAIMHLKEMITLGLTDILSWNIIVKGFCQGGYVRKAYECIGRMITSSHMLEESTYAALIFGYCRRGEFDNALYIFRQSCMHNLTLESECCSILISDLCTVKKIWEAAEVFYCVIHKGSLITSCSLDILVRLFCKSGNMHEAVKINSLAVASGILCLPSTYSAIFLALLGFRNKKIISAFLSYMVVGCRALDATTYCILVHGFYLVGMSMEAALAFNQMIDANFLPDAETLEMLVVNFAEMHLLHAVADRLQKVIKDEELLSPRMYNIVISGLSIEGHKLEASTFLDKMLEKGWIPDAEAHSLLVGNANLLKDNDETAPKDVLDNKISNILAEGLYVSEELLPEE